MSAVIDAETGEIVYRELRIDPEFRSLIPPLEPEEYTQLEANLLAEGCRDALVAWRSGDELTLADGHNRYEICQRHTIPYAVTEREFDTREDAKVWILRNQLGRRNLPEPARVRLVLALKPALEQQAEVSRLANLKQGEQRPERPISDVRETGRTDEALADQIGIGKNKLRQAEYVLTRAPQWIADTYSAEAMTANRAYELAKALEAAAPPIVAYVERYQIDDLHKVEYLKQLLFDTVKRYGRENTSEGTFWEIYHSDCIQPGEDFEAVPFSTASLVAVQKAIALKAKFHAKIEASARQQERLDRAQHLPTGVYSVIYADPPWHYDNSGFAMSAEKQYGTMPTDAICALLDAIELKVADLAVLFLWATNPLLEDALRVLRAWGFTYRTNFAWGKDRASGGFYAKGQHELLLVATRGGSFLPSALFPTLISESVTTHSKKPDMHALIEAMYPQQHYVELFARANETREGWDFWGDEANAST